MYSNKKVFTGIVLTALTLIIGLNIGCMASSEESPINWMDYERGMTQAKKEGKPTIINFYGKWCPPCRQFDRETFQDKEVYENSKNFVCVKVDAGKRGDLSGKYRAFYTPTIIFINSQGREVDRIVGYVNANSFLGHMEDVLAIEKLTKG